MSFVNGKRLPRDLDEKVGLDVCGPQPARPADKGPQCGDLDLTPKHEQTGQRDDAPPTTSSS